MSNEGTHSVEWLVFSRMGLFMKDLEEKVTRVETENRSLIDENAELKKQLRFLNGTIGVMQERVKYAELKLKLQKESSATK
jgi:hypothetical protein